MNSFKLGQRIRVLEYCDCLAPPPQSKHQALLHGKTGAVTRLRHTDSAAWVTMDDDLPQEIRAFTDANRSRAVMLWPQECAAIKGPK